jgi:hypothetical protein
MTAAPATATGNESSKKVKSKQKPFSYQFSEDFFADKRRPSFGCATRTTITT